MATCKICIVGVGNFMEVSKKISGNSDTWSVPALFYHRLFFWLRGGAYNIIIELRLSLSCLYSGVSVECQSFSLVSTRVTLSLASICSGVFTASLHVYDY